MLLAIRQWLEALRWPQVGILFTAGAEFHTAGAHAMATVCKLAHQPSSDLLMFPNLSRLSCITHRRCPQGPSGMGVDQLYTPEINTDYMGLDYTHVAEQVRVKGRGGTWNAPHALESAGTVLSVWAAGKRCCPHSLPPYLSPTTATNPLPVLARFISRRGPSPDPQVRRPPCRGHQQLVGAGACVCGWTVGNMGSY